jgi:hypothetical protein
MRASVEQLLPRDEGALVPAVSLNLAETYRILGDERRAEALFIRAAHDFSGWGTTFPLSQVLQSLGRMQTSRAAPLIAGSELSKFLDTYKDYHTLCAEQEGAPGGELPDWPGTPDGDGVARLDVAVVGGEEPGRKGVRKEENLLVGNVTGHLERVDVSERYAGVFGLTACVTAQHMRIAVHSSCSVSPHRLLHPAVGIGVFTHRVQFLLAVETLAARDREGHYHPVADAQVLHLASYFHDLAHELVT